MTLELRAPAKLNLFLEVLGKRPDGYHELDSVFAEVDLADTVRLAPAAGISLTVEGGDAPAGPANLAWRAAEALGVGAEIHLVKRIPAGAGLGGGSSDAAAVLRGLAQLYGIGTDLAGPARALGADVPFFLTGGTARCRGIGEQVEPVAGGAGRRFILLTPKVSMQTTSVFRALDAGLIEKPESATVFLAEYLAKEGSAPFFNRLQVTAESLEPGLREVRKEGERVFGVPFTLTGSGSSYFGEVAGMEGTPSRDGFVTRSGVPVEVRAVRTA